MLTRFFYPWKQLWENCAARMQCWLWMSLLWSHPPFPLRTIPGLFSVVKCICFPKCWMVVVDPSETAYHFEAMDPRWGIRSSEHIHRRALPPSLHSPHCNSSVTISLSASQVMHVICLQQVPMYSKYMHIHTCISKKRALIPVGNPVTRLNIRIQEEQGRARILNEFTVLHRELMHTGNFSTGCPVLWVRSKARGQRLMGQ